MSPRQAGVVLTKVFNPVIICFCYYFSTMHIQNSLQEQKALIRSRLKKIRAGIPVSMRRTYNRQIHNRLSGMDEVISAESVFIYISTVSEVDTHPAIRQFTDEGKSLAVPRIVDADHMIHVPFSAWEDLKPGAMEILTPDSITPYSDPIDIAITPGLGFTLHGARIGFGRGYYDNWFSTHAVKTKIALAYEAQIISEIPVHECDIPIDIIVTEKRVIRVSKSID